MHCKYGFKQIEIQCNKTIFFCSGDGTCKHVAALLFGLQAFVQSLTDRSAIGVTDQLAKWTNPTRSSRPVKVIQLDLRRDTNGETPTKPTGQFYKPVYTPQQEVENKSIEKQVYKLMKTEELEACAAYTLSDSSESEYEFENTVHDNVLDLAKTANNTFENFLNVLKMYYNRDVCEQIFQDSKSQSSCDTWFYQRLGRITASIVHSCLHFTGRNENGFLIKQILGQYNNSNINVASLNHGKKYEIKARDMYIEEQQTCHGNFNCDLSGFVISREIPYIGASPDGFVQCDCCGKGCIEIKCPFLYAKNTAFEAVCHDSKNFEIIQGVPSLVKKESSPYFCQIQCQLAVTKREWCDLVIYTHSGIFTHRVNFDASLWEKITDKLAGFYKKYVYSKLCP